MLRDANERLGNVDFEKTSQVSVATCQGHLSKRHVLFIHAVSRPQFNSTKASQSYMKSAVGNLSFFYGLVRYNDGVPTDNLRVPKDRF